MHLEAAVSITSLLSIVKLTAARALRKPHVSYALMCTHAVETTVRLVCEGSSSCRLASRF